MVRERPWFVARLLSGWLLLLSTGPAPASALSQTKGDRVIVGRVVEGLTDRGVPHAEVRLVGREVPGTRLTALADARGDFVFLGLRPGRYLLESMKPGYLNGVHGQRRPGGGGTAAIVDPAEVGIRVILPVWKGGVIAGTVYDQSGAGLPNVTVSALKRIGSGGEEQFSSREPPTARSDDRGQYRIIGLPAGEYAVLLSSTWSVAPRRFGTDPAWSRQTVFYPSARSSPESVPIVLTDGGIRDGIDFHIEAGEPRQLAGTVVAPPGTGRFDVRLLVDDAAVSEAIAVARDLTAQDGSFRFSGVLPGRYRIVAFDESGSGPDNPVAAGVQPLNEPFPRDVGRLPAPTSVSGWGHASVQLDEADITDALVPFYRGVQIQGQLRAASAGASKQADVAWQDSVVIHLVPSGPVNWLPSALLRLRVVSPDGRLESSRLPSARYFVRVATNTIPPEWALESIETDGVDLMDSPLVITDSGAPTVTVTMTNKRSEIRGVVRGERGLDSNASVIIFPAAAPRVPFGPGSPRFQSMRTTASGQYSLRGLPAGRYSILAIPDEFGDNWQTGTALSRFASAAVPVTVPVGGEPRVVNLQTFRLR
jgi:hypothetical protein